MAAVALRRPAVKYAMLSPRIGFRLHGWRGVPQRLRQACVRVRSATRDSACAGHLIQVNGNAAWAIFEWSFTGKLANGQPFTSKGWESHVYEKTRDGWRIAHLHYSGQPAQSQ